MTPTERIDAAITSISRCYDTGTFQQLQLLTSNQFLSHLRDRGLSVWKEELDYFTDFIPPIDTFGEDEPLYHPYQVWAIDRLTELLTPNLAWVSWMRMPRDRLDAAMERHLECVDTGLDRLREDSANFYEMLAIVSMSEPRYLPDIRRKLISSSTRPGEAAYGRYIAWRAAFDPAMVISDLGVEAEEISRWHQRLSTRAANIDDAEHWYLLIRHSSFEKRDRLKGRLRLAYDYYEMAEILRLLLRQANGEVVPAEDEYFGGGHREWKTRAYGVEEISFAERLVLKRVVREFSLDAAYRGYWFVEGDTEVGFFTELSEGSGINLEERAIALVNLGGGGDITQRRKEVAQRLRGSRQFVEVLTKLRTDEVFTFVTADDDAGIEDGLQSLRRQGLLTAGFVKWRGDFEEGNFTVEELITVIKRFMDLKDDQGVPITSSEVEEERKKLDGSGRPKSLGKALEDVARRKSGWEQFSKSEGWGRALAAYALEYPQLNGNLRPALQAWQRALSMSYAHFSGTSARFECNADGDLTPREPMA